jgi:hypothetical protein
MMNMSKWMLVATVACWPLASGWTATIEWTGGGDGVSTFQEANWVVTDNTGQPGWTLGASPPAGAVNPNTNIETNAIVAGSGTAGGTGASGIYRMIDGVSLTVRDDATFRMAASIGIQNDLATDRSGLIIEGNGLVAAQFLLRLDVVLRDNGQLILFGGGDPLNATTIDLDLAWTGSIVMDNETVADWTDPASSITDAHITKVTVGGAPAVIGGNVQIVSDGGTGSILTLNVVPEPSTLALAGLVLIAAGTMLRRRLQ